MKTSRIASAALLLAIFAVSGFAGLVYEILWIRDFGFLLGNTVQTVSIVLAAYMTGLAAGSWSAGRLARRVSRPLAVYAAIEIAIGAAGCGVYYVFHGWIKDLGVIAISGHETLIPALERFGVAFAVLLVPTFLMGATLPMLTRYFARREESLGAAVGSLYGANTFGAAAGCFTTGFFLIRLYGMERSTWIAVGLNLAVGALALVLDRIAGSTDVEPEEDPVPAPGPGETAASAGPTAVPDGTPDVPQRPTGGTAFMLIMVCLAGYASLSYEVLYARFLSYFLGNRVYASTTMITSFLLGMAIGSLIAGWIVDRYRREVLFFSVLQVTIGSASVLIAARFPDALDLMKYLEGGLHLESPIQQVLIRFSGSFAILFIPALASGAAFPVAVRYLVRGGGGAGAAGADTAGADAASATGRAYAFNTAGCIAGSLVTGFAVVPAFGSYNAMVLTAVLSILLGHRLLAWDWRGSPGWRRAASVATVAVLALLSLRIARGTRYPWERPGLVRIFSREESAALVTAYTGPLGFYLYADDTELSFPIGPLTAAERVQWLQAHIPIMLHPDPKRVLVVGMGFGATSAAYARYDGLEKVETVELLRGVIEAGRLFNRYNRGVFSPKSELIAGDGRHHLRTARMRYDIIATNVNGSDLPGSAGCYTKEYFELARSRLADDGIFLLHVFGVDRPIVYKTLAGVFPFVIGFRAYKHTEFLLASMNPIDLDRKRVEDRLKHNPQFAMDTVESGVRSFDDLRKRFLFGATEFVEMARNDEPENTDSFPVLEYRIRPGKAGLFEARLAHSVTFVEKTAFVSAVGDVLLYHWPSEKVYRRVASETDNPEQMYRYPFERIRHEMRGIVFGNLEGPLTKAPVRRVPDKGEPFYFRQPPEFARALVAGGCNVLSLANNHIMDCGDEGLKETMTVLRAAGIRSVGAGEDMQRARRPVIVEENGVRVGFLAYNLVKPASARAGKGRPGTSWAEGRDICEDVIAARRRCDALTVALHWGTETTEEFDPTPPSEARVKLARAIIDSGACLVVGSHSHAIERIERYKDGLICYGLGNFVFAGTSKSRHPRSIVIRATVSRDGVVNYRRIPVLIAPFPGGLPSGTVAGKGKG